MLHSRRLSCSGLDVDVSISSYENTLGVGIEEHIGYIMFQDRSNAPDRSFEFDVGGTPTPISLRRCIPIERLVGLVKYY